ncbi:hypothetical protein AAH979_39830 [Plantactinospora sp. ZYX-F-223]|uniref:hypothetical protein n=1 Tax=Plantactinospora sp. ZYX-F-223 TaxID=3144103 RepID=UPI0031FDD7C6
MLTQQDSGKANRAFDRDHDRRIVVGRQLHPPLMRSMIVEVLDVLADHARAVSL